MVWLHVVTVLVVAQYMGFGILVGWARGRYEVHAPAVTGHPMFERLYRVHMNSLEQMVTLLPAMYLSAQFWSPMWSAAAGVAYIVGRFVYLKAYANDPKSRTLGFVLGYFPIMGLLAATLVGAVMAG